ncbi:cyclic AMP-responsive element-binding protein 3-like protein 3, partial [Caerostris darwini]
TRKQSQTLYFKKIFRLQKKVQSLESQQKTLLDQIKYLQSLISNSGKTAQASTCLLVIFISFALLLFPSLFPNFHAKLTTPAKNEMSPTGASRVLLSSQDAESNSVETKPSTGNINRSQEYIIVPRKQEFYEEPQPQMFRGFEEADLNSPKRYRVASKYELPHPEFRKDASSTLLQNESSFIELHDTGHNRSIKGVLK